MCYKLFQTLSSLISGHQQPIVSLPLKLSLLM